MRTKNYEMIIYNNDGEYFTRVIVKNIKFAQRHILNYNKKFGSKYSGKVLSLVNGEDKRVEAIIEWDGHIVGGK